MPLHTLDIRPFLIRLRAHYIGRAAASDKFLPIEDMLYGSVHPVLIAMVDLMDDSVFDASEIPLPDGVGVY